MIKRILVAISLCLAAVLLMVSPVLAVIGNPDTIAFGSVTGKPLYNVFNNVLVTGDWLITAESYVHYTVTPTDYNASQAFIFELVSANGTTISSMPLVSYEDKPIGIYLSKGQADSANLTIGDPYIIRIEGNPIIFPTPVGNSVNATLAGTDYINQNLGSDNGTPTNNLLRNFMITMAQHLQAHDSPVDLYLTSVQGYSYLTIAGGDIFSAGIANLQGMCPILYASGTTPMSSDAPQHTGTYALTLTPGQKWGATTAAGLTNLGVWLGINQALAGSVVLFILAIALSAYMYKKLQSGMAVLLVLAATPFFGAYLGLMPIALAFVFMIMLVTLLGYFFFARGVL